MSTTVLLCTDGSELALHALAAGMAVLPPADRTVVATVIAPDDPTLVTGTGFAGGVMTPEQATAFEADRRSEAQAILGATITGLGLDGAEGTVLVGDAGRAICELAASLPASVVVIGTRGRGGLRRAMLGSVSDHVVRNAPCPVVTSGAD